MARPLTSLSSKHSRAPSSSTLIALRAALSNLTLCSSSLGSIQTRHASHAAQGRANGAKDGPGKRLGAKKTDGQYVVPGNILYRQRGTLWFPGDGCFMGRDHTIHAKVPGYVKYYLDPSYPSRKYIGVVFQRDNVLPQPYNAARRRMLGMLAYRMPSTRTEQVSGDLTSLSAIAPDSTTSSDAGNVSTIIRETPTPYRHMAFVKDVRKEGSGKPIKAKLLLGRGYQWRQPNWEIGRTALRSKAAMRVRPYDPKDRFLAWRKRNARRAAAAEKRAMGRGGKGGKKKSK